MRRLRYTFFVLTSCALAQTSEGPLAPPSVSEKWNLFERETFAPMTLGAAAFNAGVSQATDSTPLYGRETWPAYPERFGSAVGDIMSQNFLAIFFSLPPFTKIRDTSAAGRSTNCCRALSSRSAAR
jgi:hypothetical protein